MFAAREGRNECVNILIKRGAIVNMRGHLGSTALMMSSEGGHHICVKLLVSAGAKVNIQKQEG